MTDEQCVTALTEQELANRYREMATIPRERYEQLIRAEAKLASARVAILASLDHLRFKEKASREVDVYGGLILHARSCLEDYLLEQPDEQAGGMGPGGMTRATTQIRLTTTDLMGYRIKVQELSPEFGPNPEIVVAVRAAITGELGSFRLTPEGIGAELEKLPSVIAFEIADHRGNGRQVSLGMECRLIRDPRGTD